jgi:hypothetical protein
MREGTTPLSLCAEWASELAVLNLYVLLPHCSLVRKTILKLITDKTAYFLYRKMGYNIIIH